MEIQTIQLMNLTASDGPEVGDSLWSCSQGSNLWGKESNTPASIRRLGKVWQATETSFTARGGGGNHIMGSLIMQVVFFFFLQQTEPWRKVFLSPSKVVLQTKFNQPHDILWEPPCDPSNMGIPSHLVPSHWEPSQNSWCLFFLRREQIFQQTKPWRKVSQCCRQQEWVLRKTTTHGTPHIWAPSQGSWRNHRTVWLEREVVWDGRERWSVMGGRWSSVGGSEHKWSEAHVSLHHY